MRPIKIACRTSAEILERCNLDEKGAALVDPAWPPEKSLSALAGSETFLDFIRFLAHALPQREALCWALACTRESGLPVTPLQASALLRVREWILEPEEPRRRVCQELAAKIGTDHPTGWLCLSVDWVGSGSIVPPDLPVVLPQPYLYAKALLGAVGLLAPSDEKAREAFVASVVRLANLVVEGAWPGLNAGEKIL